MKQTNLFLPVFCLFILSGCAVSSTIEDASKSESKFDSAALYDGQRTEIQKPLKGVQQHRIFHQGSTGFTPVSAVRASAMSRVSEFCGLNGRNPYLVEETTSKPPHILGNWPRAEIVFSCVDKKQRSSSVDKYDQIAKLKSLFDDGAITESEFNFEKQKLLAQ